MQKRTSQLIRSIFDVNHPLLLLAEKWFGVFILNILFVLTCLPLLTYGIAKLSLIASLQDLQRSSKISLLSVYTGHLRRQWKRGLQLGIAELGLTLFCLVDLYMIQGQEGLPFQIFRVLCYAVLIFSQLVWLYAYPLAVDWKGSFLHLLGRAVLASGLALPLTTGAFFIMGLLVLVLFWSGLSFLLTLSVLAVFGYACLIYLFLLVWDKLPLSQQLK